MMGSSPYSWPLDVAQLCGASGGSLNDILNSPDAKAALASAMGGVTEPDYMWLGNEASTGATEVGGSGYDLTGSLVEYQQTDAVLGADVMRFTGVTDSLYNTTDTQLQFGAGSFAVLMVIDPIAWDNTEYIASDIETSPSLQGWRFYTLASGTLNFDCAFGGTNYAAQVTGPHSAGVGHVILAVRNATDTSSTVWTRDGSATNASTPASSITPTSPRFAMGDGNTGNPLEFYFGFLAVWKGAAAESLGETQRAALASYLGYE